MNVHEMEVATAWEGKEEMLKRPIPCERGRSEVTWYGAMAVELRGFDQRMPDRVLLDDGEPAQYREIVHVCWTFP